MKKGLVITAGALLFIGACVAVVDKNENASGTTENMDTIPTANSESTYDSMKGQVEPQAPKSAWSYNESIDEMTDRTTYLASVVSENSVYFDFPYQGGSTLTFTLRDSPQYGKDAYIRISTGQFNSSYNGTTIKMRIDDKPAQTINCSEASDNSTDLLFLRGYNKIVKALKGAKTMKISAEFFSEGVRTFTFDVSGLEWNH